MGIIQREIPQETTIEGVGILKKDDYINIIFEEFPSVLEEISKGKL